MVSIATLKLDAPLSFVPRYQVLVWGGRRMAEFRDDLPAGPVGESWDLADHDRGMSVVRDGFFKNRSLNDLVRAHGADLVGPGFSGDRFPLLVKLIDATDRLSVQVHPDDALARALGVGDNGKAECWLLLADGGTLYQGTVPGIDRTAFESALAAARVEESLNRFDCRAGDFFFLQGRTVHALGAGCLLYEVQQTSDVTFRIWDWGRMGLDGKPRPVHLRESLETIDFSRTGFGPRPAITCGHVAGGQVRRLIDCRHFRVEERILAAVEQTTRHHGREDVEGEGQPVCSVVSCFSGAGRIETAGGEIDLKPMQTVLIPAAAHGFRAQAAAPNFRFLHATPHLS